MLRSDCLHFFFFELLCNSVFLILLFGYFAYGMWSVKHVITLKKKTQSLPAILEIGAL